jgi:hypothetical protein
MVHGLADLGGREAEVLVRIDLAAVALAEGGEDPHVFVLFIDEMRKYSEGGWKWDGKAVSPPTRPTPFPRTCSRCRN